MPQVDALAPKGRTDVGRQAGVLVELQYRPKRAAETLPCLRRQRAEGVQGGGGTIETGAGFRAPTARGTSQRGRPAAAISR